MGMENGLETHYMMKVPHEMSLLSQHCLRIRYSVMVLCPESQDRGSPKPSLPAHISAPSSEFSRHCWLPCQPLRSCQSGVERCHPESLSSFLCSQKNQERGRITAAAAAFGALPEEVCCATLPGHRLPLPQQVLCLFVLDAACVHGPVGEVCPANT